MYPTQTLKMKLTFNGDAEEQPRNEDDQAEARIPTGDAEVEERDTEDLDYEPEPDELPLEESNPRYVNPPLSQVQGSKELTPSASVLFLLHFMSRRLLSPSQNVI